ncbi:MAG: DUF86 domain-containing protein [Candidatus Margulisbacteria bacterium]|nr:DUF86 domain-containing protein [Candidatus Margulisiibacteriota bacterium]
MRQYKVYIQDIIKAVNAIEKFVENMDIKSFLSDDKTSSAVIRKFEIMGEAAKQVPSEIQSQFPEIPWKEIARMRDKLIHHYAGVNLFILYETIENELPKLKEKLAVMLSKLNSME